jgi:hypothetical protein
MKNLLLISLLLCVSCKNENQLDSSALETSTQETSTQETKLFLEYWAGMNHNEFLELSKFLEKKDLVAIIRNTVYYNMGNTRLEISPFFDTSIGNKKCIGVELSEFTEKSYDVFKAKYNIPNYIKIEPKIILEENPLYLQQSNDKYQIGKKIADITRDEAIELINEIADPLYTSVPPISYIIASPEEIVIKKKDVVIQAKLHKRFLSNTEYDCVNKLKVYAKSSYTSFHYPNGDETGRFRIVVKYDGSEFKVRYFPRNYYESEQLKIEKYRKNSLLNQTEDQEKIKEREKKAFNEI